MLISNIFDFLKEPLEKLKHDLTTSLIPQSSLLKETSNYHFQADGKYLRTVLCFLSAKTYGELNNKHFEAGRIIEYLHNATLLHDDVIDCSDLRRGQKTVRYIWDNHTSVVTGNYLFSEALNLLVQLQNPKALKLVTETTLAMIHGELTQLVQPYSTLKFEHYYDIICKKTAKLFGVSASFGGLFADAPEQWSEQLYQYGLNVGIAFQIVDDTLDYIGQTEQTGKAVGNDLKERKATLPLVYLMETSQLDDRSELLKILQSKQITDQQVLSVIEMAQHYQVIDQSLDTAKHYVTKALNALTSLPESQAKTLLEQAAQFIVHRAY